MFVIKISYGRQCLPYTVKFDAIALALRENLNTFLKSRPLPKKGMICPWLSVNPRT
jgi:hypothetical protein